MFRLPILAMVYGMEIFVKTVHGFQRIADQSVDALTSPPDAAPGGMPLSSEGQSGPAQPATAADACSSGTQEQHTEEVRKEQIKMPDTNLNDDMLKLVRYKILFIKRDYEVAFPEQEELVYDNMNDGAFTAWKVAEFIQSLNRMEVPSKWEKKAYPEGVQVRNEHGRTTRYIHSLPEDDKKYLRVYFEVLQRYPREKFKHDEREVEELEKIRRILDDRLHTGGTAATAASPPPPPAVPEPTSGGGRRSPGGGAVTG